MKNKKDLEIYIAYLLPIIIVAVLSLGISYWIATSDLPDWFKFWLLK